ncbi:hypothetical protein SS1G_06497 [Sclerotinia sclerotiorum 1980 UF-70]|uniref:Reverse transcriptase domain-containing protein n=1 Tax=Sclerotinia sclerotiorum (strain ATCC 18683 / 1980 / Ss-1) TaxID=665079 RepID=A7EME9_SCLS1|nr:hypothetical protein SS1G_06497 [Sclerotinia sclerotiorum 1980 UF-70]EDO04015.1 hypothetical protein SS1G_06497 [Sclerotinia sclerotiorum 1980 UF-70]
MAPPKESPANSPITSRVNTRSRKGKEKVPTLTDPFARSGALPRSPPQLEEQEPPSLSDEDPNDSELPGPHPLPQYSATEASQPIPSDASMQLELRNQILELQNELRRRDEADRLRIAKGPFPPIVPPEETGPRARKHSPFHPTPASAGHDPDYPENQALPSIEKTPAPDPRRPISIPLLSKRKVDFSGGPGRETPQVQAVRQQSLLNPPASYYPERRIPNLSSKLSDGKAPNIRIRAWEKMILGHLLDYHHDFRSENARRTWVFNQTEDRAMTLLEGIYLDDDYDAYALVDHVVAILTDPAEVATANIEYNALRMSSKEHFWEFYSRFRDVATRAAITDDERLKNDLFDKTQYRLVHDNKQEFHQARTVGEYARALQNSDIAQQRLDARPNYQRAKAPTLGTRNPGTTLRSDQQQSRTSGFVRSPPASSAARGNIPPNAVLPKHGTFNTPNIQSNRQPSASRETNVVSFNEVDEVALLDAHEDYRLDLRTLLGGPHITVPIMLVRDGIAVKFDALIDSGANGYAFMDPATVKHLDLLSKAKTRKLPKPLSVKGYDGTIGKYDISFVSYFDLHIDKRIQRKTPFLILPLGSHRIILGRQWLAYHDIWLNCRRRQFRWPESTPPSVSFSRYITIPRNSLPIQKTINRYHQYDADRRDRKFGKDIAAPKINLVESFDQIDQIEQSDPIEPTPLIDPQLSQPDHNDTIALETLAPTISSKRGNTHEKSLNRDIVRMNKLLKSPETPPKPTQPYPRKPRLTYPISSWDTPSILDIAAIDAHIFNRYLLKSTEKDQLFTCTYHEVETLLDQRYEEQDRHNELATFEQALKRSSKERSTKALALLAMLEPDEPPLPDKYHEFEDVFSKQESDILPPHRSYDHSIKLEDRAEESLTYSPLYKMSIEELEVVKRYLTDNLSKGFIEPSQAPFAAPVLFVKKSNGSLRFCIDYRKLNALTRKDRYPLPLIDETLARLQGAKIYTKLDIRQAFHRIRMDPASEEYTTFRTRYGAYKCKVLPFGLTNGPATYQRYMNDILFDYLDDFCTAYLDDILIYSEDPSEHDTHVRKVLQRLRDAGLQADLKKSEFDVTKTKYLGFIISTTGIEVDPDKVAIVKEWQYPSTLKGVQSFLGFCNFYRRFIPSYGVIASPLTHLTKTNVPFSFNQECKEAFNTLRGLLTTAPILRHYDYKLESMLETDASDGVIAAVLSQKHDDHWFPVAYFSKTMLPAELNYPVHDKELTAIAKSFGHWRAELIGSPFQVKVYTDHKALEYFMTSKQLNSRQARVAELLADFNFLIMYRPGKENPLADALSRREDDIQATNHQKKEQRAQQLFRPDQLDPNILRQAKEAPILAPLERAKPFFTVIDRILEANRNSTSLTAMRREAIRASEDPNRRSPLTIENGLLLHKGRVVIPSTDNLHTYLIREVHAQPTTAHPNAEKTSLLISEHYYWKGFRDDVARYVRNCDLCRRSKVPRDKKPGLLKPLSIPQRPWEHITMDFCSFNKDKYGERIRRAIHISMFYRYYGSPSSILIPTEGTQIRPANSGQRGSPPILEIQASNIPSTGPSPPTDGETEILQSIFATTSSAHSGNY